jgi:hypothetical protein
MKNQPLIQEVISQISQRFTPKIPDIKKVGRRHSIHCVPELTRVTGNRHVAGEGIYRARGGDKGYVCLRGLIRSCRLGGSMLHCRRVRALSRHCIIQLLLLLILFLWLISTIPPRSNNIVTFHSRSVSVHFETLL